VVRIALWRLAAIVPIMLVASFVTFGLLALNPTDPAEQLLGPTATEEQVATLRAEMGLDDPVLERYVDWLGGAVTGDLGTSIYSGAPVADTINERVGVTLSMIVGGLLVAVVIGVPSGMAAALRSGRPTDRAVMAVASLGQAIPVIWLGTLLLAAFAVHWHVFNAVFYVSPFESIAGWIRSITLPSIALGVVTGAVLSRHIRMAVRSELGAEYVRAALAKGASQRQAVVHHVLRNAASSMVTVLSFLIAALLGGSFVVERIFALPGLGSMAIEAVQRNDPAPLLGFVVVTVFVVVVVNLLLDLGYAWLNPRVRTA
jgi:peptide/nickel transport system permease protein